ncbi:MAG: hypothetical protein UZ12_BCD005001062 [Bacteroidetes bacterium OLB12]|nr:MAG: hypothetical protein UZ12_BCD005001062 [Bacteroidetes bacterium OLB12]HNR73884.1 hypothetical protein [Cyclobacteriaceae bacterium]HNU41446.1 hypothetical protein [Cyclobacteriaceae bacterium]
MSKKATQIARLILQALILSSMILLTSCNEDIPEVRDPCDFIRSVDEVSLDISTACNECFFKFSFQGRVYDFRDERFESSFGCEEEEKCLITYKNAFFDFKFKSLDRSSDLFSSLKEQRALLTPDSLILTDFNFLQPSFRLKDRCNVEYQVAKNTNIFFPDVSSNTIMAISVWNFSVIDDGVNPIRYSTSYLISGTFSTQILVDDNSESIGGSYALLYTITEPF